MNDRRLAIPPSPSKEEEPAGEIEGRSSQSSKGSSSSKSSSSSSNEAALEPAAAAAAEAMTGKGEIDDFATRQLRLSAAHGAALFAMHGDGMITALCDVEATAWVAARSEDAIIASKKKLFPDTKSTFFRNSEKKEKK